MPFLEIDTYKSLLHKLKAIDQDQYSSVDIFDRETLELYTQNGTTSTCKKINELIEDVENRVVQVENRLTYFENRYRDNIALIENNIKMIDELKTYLFAV